MVVFFDANLPKLKDCCNVDCLNDESVLCIHRFVCETYVLYGNGTRKRGLSDLGVVSFFWDLVKKDQLLMGKNCIYVLTTGDQKFINAVKREWEKDGPCFSLTDIEFQETEGVLIVNKSLLIRIETVRMWPYGWNKKNILSRIIARCNELCLGNLAHPPD